MVALQILVFVPFLFQLTTAQTFTWSDCAPNHQDSWIDVKQISVTPSPVVIPGVMTLSLSGDVKHEIPQNVTLNVLMQKELLGHYTKIPCYQNVGTCVYDSPCEFLQQFGKNGCPEALTRYGLPCTCPFHLANLDLPPSTFQISHLTPAWRWLINGKYYMKVELMYANTVVGCFDVHVEYVVSPSAVG